MFGIHPVKGILRLFTLFSAIDMEILCLTKRTWIFPVFCWVYFWFHFVFLSGHSNQIVSHVKNSGKMTKFKIETNDPVCVRLTFPPLDTQTHPRTIASTYSNSKYFAYLCAPRTTKWKSGFVRLYISLHIFPFIIIYGCCVWRLFVGALYCAARVHSITAC